MAISFDTELNEQQAEAVYHDAGPLLILAGAGSGKTRVITCRIARLLADGVTRPGRVLAITFTNKAARELKKRLEELVGTGVDQMWVGTFHAVCNRILRYEARAAGLAPAFGICDAADQRTLCREIIAELDLPRSEFNETGVAGAISRAKDDLLDPAAYRERASSIREQNIARVYERYQERLQRSQNLDFGDLIVKVVRLFETRPDVLERYGDRFEHILVDEYQDTNHAQYVLTRQLARKHRNLAVVGDDDQSIYGWRGADLRNILDFEREFPGARVVKLETNYRSTTPILEAANHVIERNRDRKEKRLNSFRGTGEPVRVQVAASDHEEADFVVDTARQLVAAGDCSFSDIAVLYRSHMQSRLLEQVCRRQVVPYDLVSGIKFYERREVKDLLAYLRVLVNPLDDISLVRVANVPRRGIGARTIEAWREEAAASGADMFTFLMSDRVPTRLTGLADVMRRLTEQADVTDTEQTLQTIIRETEFIDRLEASSEEEHEQRLGNIEELVRDAGEFGLKHPDQGVVGFLTEVSLVSDADAIAEDTTLTMMTIHAAKGLEYDVVFLVGMDEGWLPHYRSVEGEEDGDTSGIEEERRLCYVAMTRARDRLIMTRAAKRVLHGRTVYCEPSRFLGDIPGQLLVQDGVMLQPQPVRRMRPVSRERRPEPPPEGSGDSDFRAGQRVLHPTFGPGMVVSVQGEGEEEKVSVAFPDLGIKTVMAKYARMKRV